MKMTDILVGNCKVEDNNFTSEMCIISVSEITFSLTQIAKCNCVKLLNFLGFFVGFWFSGDFRVLVFFHS